MDKISSESGGMQPDGEDEGLMCCAAAGDLEAFSRLFRMHRGRVEQFLYTLFGDRDQAEDGTQEVFIKLWMARRRYRPRARFTTFLYSVARNYWLDERRKSQRRPSPVAMPEETDEEAGCPLLLAPAATEPHHELFQRYEQWRVRTAVARLPEIYRMVFILGHLEDCTTAEIAVILEIPVGTVKSRMYTAIRLLRNSLDPE